MNKAVFISKPSHLPVALFAGGDKTLTSSFPKLTVNYASLGHDKNKKFIVADGAHLDLCVINEMHFGEAFEVQSGGMATIVCQGEVVINGGTVRNGGTLVIRANNTTINCSFTVEAGASLTIEKP